MKKNLKKEFFKTLTFKEKAIYYLFGMIADINEYFFYGIECFFLGLAAIFEILVCINTAISNKFQRLRRFFHRKINNIPLVDRWIDFAIKNKNK